MAEDIGTDCVDNVASVEKYKASPLQRAVVMTHGSVDVSTGKAYVVNPDNSAAFFDRGNTKGDGTDGWLYRSNLTMTPNEGDSVAVDVYIAVSWKMTFTYDFAGETDPVAVYLDLAESQFTNPDPVTGYDFTRPGTNDAGKGFRIGFYGAVKGTTTTAAEYKHDVVWGNNVPIAVGDVPAAWNDANAYSTDNRVLKDGVIYRAIAPSAASSGWDNAKWVATGRISLNASKDCDATYVSGTAATSKYNAAGKTEYVVRNVGYQRKHSGDETLGEGEDVAAERICVLTSTQPSVTVTCAAWFEGTDPNVVSGNALTCLGAKMTFYSRSVNPES